MDNDSVLVLLFLNLGVAIKHRLVKFRLKMKSRGRLLWDTCQLCGIGHLVASQFCKLKCPCETQDIFFVTFHEQLTKKAEYFSTTLLWACGCVRFFVENKFKL